MVVIVCVCVFFTAGKMTTNEELEEMLESGNPSIFTSDVSLMKSSLGSYDC